MGGEFGQWNEWNYDDEPCSGTCCSGSRTSGVQKIVADLNRLYRREPALHEVDFDYHGIRVDRLPQLGESSALAICAGRRP